jgi:hypothetical protein
VNWVRRYLSSVSVTPLGGVILLILAVAVGLFLFGPSSVQAPGLIVAVLLLAGLLGVSPFGRGGTGLWRSGSLAGRRREFNPRARNVSDDPLSASEEAELWRKERERRAEDQRR